MKRRVAILILWTRVGQSRADRCGQACGFSGRDRCRHFQPGRCGRAREGSASGIPTTVIESKPFGKDRAGFEVVLQRALEEAEVELMCLGGFMRLFTAEFVQRWYGRMLNIHPSLLPSFPGLDPHGEALQAGVKISGATVHFVIPERDIGPIVMQGAVAVADDDTAETLSQRILDIEHRIYPEALRRSPAASFASKATFASSLTRPIATRTLHFAATVGVICSRARRAR